MTGANRDATMQLRISTADKERLRRAAELEGLDLTTFVLLHARRAADAVLAERWTFTLDDSDFADFVAALDAPAVELPGLRALTDAPSPFASR